RPRRSLTARECHARIGSVLSRVEPARTRVAATVLARQLGDARPRGRVSLVAPVGFRPAKHLYTPVRCQAARTAANPRVNVLSALLRRFACWGRRSLRRMRFRGEVEVGLVLADQAVSGIGEAQKTHVP